MSVSAVGTELATHCPPGYGANTGWASVEFTNSTLPQPQRKVHQGHTTCHWANGLPAFALLSKVDALAPPRSWGWGKGNGQMMKVTRTQATQKARLEPATSSHYSSGFSAGLTQSKSISGPCSSPGMVPRSPNWPGVVPGDPGGGCSVTTAFRGTKGSTESQCHLPFGMLRKVL